MQDNYDFNDEMTKLLLKHESNVNLHIAVINKQETLADLLTSNEADINARNKEGKTPLIMLISSKEFYGNHVNLVKLLLKHGAKVNSSDYRGKTALRYATSLCRYFTFYLSEADLTMFADDTALTITAKSLEELGEKVSQAVAQLLMLKSACFLSVNESKPK